MSIGKEMLDEARNDAAYDDWCGQSKEFWEPDFTPITWTTNGGEVLFIVDMDTLHIQNCIVWLQTNRAGNPMMPRMVAAFEAELKSRGEAL